MLLPLGVNIIKKKDRIGHFFQNNGLTKTLHQLKNESFKCKVTSMALQPTTALLCINAYHSIETIPSEKSNNAT